MVQGVCAVGGGVQQLAVNDQALRRAWESSQRSTKEDWAEWMRHFAVELLKESPSHALRATHLLAQVCLRGCDQWQQSKHRNHADLLTTLLNGVMMSCRVLCLLRRWLSVAAEDMLPQEEKN